MRFYQGLALASLTALLGCSTIGKMAIRGQARTFERVAISTNSEGDWEWFREATPANLQLLEGLVKNVPSNDVLRRTLIRGYAGYAYAVFETLAWEEQILDAEERPWEERARAHYARALEHGKHYFLRGGIKWGELLATDDREMRARMDQAFNDDDLGAVLFTAQAWAGLINLKKSDVGLVAQLPRARALFDWVCQRQPAIENGACPLFYAQYELSRPKFLGGDPEKGAALFSDYARKHPHHLLARVNRMYYALLPRDEGEEFAREAAELARAPAGKDTDLNLFNAIARRRLLILNRHRAKLF
jgi:hypothetical protein